MDIRKNYFDFYTPEEWGRILEAYVKSGLSVVNYCKEKGIPTSSFYGWKRRLDPSSVTNLKDRRDKWIHIIEDWENTCLSKREYCKGKEFSAEELSLWQKRLNPSLSRNTTLEKWTEIIEDWKKSGLGKSLYCRKKKLGTSQFYKWEKKIRCSEASQSPSDLVEELLTKTEISSFTSLAFDPILLRKSSSTNSKIEVTLPQGHHLCLESTFDQDVFKEWIASLLETESKK